MGQSMTMSTSSDDNDYVPPNIPSKNRASDESTSSEGEIENISQIRQATNKLKGPRKKFNAKPATGEQEKNETLQNKEKAENSKKLIIPMMRISNRAEWPGKKTNPITNTSEKRVLKKEDDPSTEDDTDSEIESSKLRQHKRRKLIVRSNMEREKTEEATKRTKSKIEEESDSKIETSEKRKSDKLLSTNKKTTETKSDTLEKRHSKRLKRQTQEDIDYSKNKKSSADLTKSKKIQLQEETDNNSESELSESDDSQKVKSRTGKEVYKCTICYFDTVHKPALLRHLKRYHEGVYDESSSFKCPECTLTYVHERSLKTHIAHSHPKKRLSCPVCDFKTFNFNEYKQHFVDDSFCVKKRVFKCKHCSYVAGLRIQLLKHEKTHQDKNDIILRRNVSLRCKHCGEKFFTMSDYQKHLKEEQSGRVDTSKTVETSTKTKPSVKKEVLEDNVTSTKKKESSFKCDHCNFVAPNKKIFSKHRRQLHGVYESLKSIVKTFKCTLCSFETKYFSNLKRHKYSVHGSISKNEQGDNRIQCDLCDESPSDHYQLAWHKFKFHSDHTEIAKWRLQCTQCSYKSYSKINCEKHGRHLHGETGTPTVEFQQYYDNVYKGSFEVKSEELDMYTCSKCDYVTHTKKYWYGHLYKHKKEEEKLAKAKEEAEIDYDHNIESEYLTKQEDFDSEFDDVKEEKDTQEEGYSDLEGKSTDVKTISPPQDKKTDISMKLDDAEFESTVGMIPNASITNQDIDMTLSDDDLNLVEKYRGKDFIEINNEVEQTCETDNEASETIIIEIVADEDEEATEFNLKENENKKSENFNLSRTDLNSFHRKSISEHTETDTNIESSPLKSGSGESSLRFVCSKAGCKYFSYKISDFKNHIQMHDAEAKTDITTFKCLICGESVLRRNMLADHTNNHAKDAGATIPEVNYYEIKNKKVVSLVRIKPDDVTELPQKKLSTELSTKNQRKNAEFVTVNQQKSKSHKCEVCGAIFFNKGLLERHASTHSAKELLGEDENLIEYSGKSLKRTFKCSECGLRMFNKKAIYSHTNAHIKATKDPNLQLCFTVHQGRKYLHSMVIRPDPEAVRKLLENVKKSDNVEDEEILEMPDASLNTEDQNKETNSTMESTEDLQDSRFELDIEETKELEHNSSPQVTEISNIHELEAILSGKNIVEERPVPVQECVYMCRLCDQELTNKMSLKLHANVHANNAENPNMEVKYFKYMGGKPVSKITVKADMNYQKSEKQVYRCEECGVMLKQKIALQNHTNMHGKNGENFDVTYQVLEDEDLVGVLIMKYYPNFDPQIFSYPPKFKCNRCDQIISFKGSLQVHTNVHGRDMGEPDLEVVFSELRGDKEVCSIIIKAELKLTCDQCNYKADNQAALLKHKKLHWNVEKDKRKWFKCDECSFSSSDSKIYKLHQEWHKNMR